MFQANAIGIFGFISVAMCRAPAVVLYRVGPAGSETRQHPLLVVVEGVVLVTSPSEIMEDSVAGRIDR
jgi:hypothetical protein